MSDGEVSETTSVVSEGVNITARCVMCKHEADFGSELGDVPMCPKCYSPMAVVAAEVRL